MFSLPFAECLAFSCWFRGHPLPSKVRVAVDDKVKAAPKEAPKEASTSASHPKDPKAKDQNTQRFWISTGQADSKGRGMVRDRKGMVRFKLTN